MNNKEKRTILEAAIDRAYTAIAETSGAEMKDERFRDLLFNIDHMESIATHLAGGEEDLLEVTGAVESQNPCPSPDANAGTTKEPLAVEETESEQTPDEDEGKTEEPTTYT